MATILNGIGVSVRYEHLHTILYKSSFIGLSIAVGLCQCEHTVNQYLADVVSRLPLLLIFGKNIARVCNALHTFHQCRLTSETPILRFSS